MQRAALELSTEQGFAETTASQITARAGLTTRTFFRYFADKREVLFAADEATPTQIARLIADADSSLSPMALTNHCLFGMAHHLESQFEYLKLRRAVIQSDDGLRERELRKQAELARTIAKDLRQRDFDDVTATIVAEIGVTVLRIAINRWLDQDGAQPLSELVHETLSTLQSIGLTTG